MTGPNKPYIIGAQKRIPKKGVACIPLRRGVVWLVSMAASGCPGHVKSSETWMVCGSEGDTLSVPAYHWVSLIF